MSTVLSSRGAKSQNCKKAAERATCSMEKITKRLLIERQHISATGMLRASMPSCVGNEKPTSEVMRSMRMATPVKPEESRPAGLMNAWMTKACSKAEMKTLHRVMRRRTKT